MTRAVRIVALMATGLLAGILVAGVLTAQAMVTQPAGVYAAVARTTHQTYAMPMLFLQFVTIAVLAALLVMTRGWPVAAALGCVLAVLVITVVVNVPINGQMIDEWPIRLPSDWAEIRDRWNAWHAVRTCFSLVAFGCLAGRAVDRAGSAP